MLRRSADSNLQPPPHPGMTTLDREKFNLTVTCRAIEVPAKSCTTIMKSLTKTSTPLFSTLQTKPKTVLPCESDKSKRTVLLRDDYDLSEFDGSMEEISEKSLEIALSYKHWSAAQIFRAIFPDDIDDTEVVSAFETIGHIAHLNLKPCHEPYKKLIGQVIVDKNAAIKTVVNKLQSIHAEYRYFDMELLAGEENFITTSIEHKIKFKMDFSKVYWNSRLGSEHKRVVDAIPVGSTVLDMFCGIGPFALPLARKKCHVHANDLNPLSYKYLLENVKLNKLSGDYITCYNMDGRDLIKKFEKQIDFVLMNLPASATEFLDVFSDLYTGCDKELSPPTVFCYHFANISDPEQISIRAVSEKLGCQIEAKEVHLVRKIAPNTWMTCVKFVVPMAVLKGESSCKRTKVEM